MMMVAATIGLSSLYFKLSAPSFSTLAFSTSLFRPRLDELVKKIIIYVLLEAVQGQL